MSKHLFSSTVLYLQCPFRKLRLSLFISKKLSCTNILVIPALLFFCYHVLKICWKYCSSYTYPLISRLSFLLFFAPLPEILLLHLLIFLEFFIITKSLSICNLFYHSHACRLFPLFLFKGIELSLSLSFCFFQLQSQYLFRPSCTYLFCSVFFVCLFYAFCRFFPPPQDLYVIGKHWVSTMQPQPMLDDFELKYKAGQGSS